VTEVPHAGAFFRKGHFKDIDKHPAEFPKWGLAHDYRLGSGEAFIFFSALLHFSFSEFLGRLKGRDGHNFHVGKVSRLRSAQPKKFRFPTYVNRHRRKFCGTRLTSLPLDVSC
jgi:hypothetical protein